MLLSSVEHFILYCKYSTKSIYIYAPQTFSVLYILLIFSYNVLHCHSFLCSEARLQVLGRLTCFVWLFVVIYELYDTFSQNHGDKVYFSMLAVVTASQTFNIDLTNKLLEALI